MAIIHSRYYKLFNWKSEFEKISVAVARIFYTLHVALILMFIIIAGISIAYAGELGKSAGLANALNILLAAFWLWRFIWQFAYFKKAKGHKRSVIVIILSVII